MLEAIHLNSRSYRRRAILFYFAGAPDLAFTQFSVEAALVIVAAAVLPSFAPVLRKGPLVSAPVKIVLALSTLTIVRCIAS